MANCTICKEEKEGMLNCKECGQYFCENCGKTGYCDACQEHAAQGGSTKKEIIEEKAEEKEVIHDVEEMEQEQDH